MPTFYIQTEEMWNTLADYAGIEADDLSEALQKVLDGLISVDGHEHGIGDDNVVSVISAFANDRELSREEIVAAEEKVFDGRNVITISIRGGCLEDVEGLPPGWTYDLIDYDNLEAEGKL